MRCVLMLFLAAVTGLILFSCSEKEKPTSPENHKPGIPQALTPPDNSTDQTTLVEFAWQCADPDGDSLKYDIYFGTQSNPPLAASGLTNPAYVPGALEYGTSYKWRVAATDEHGASVSGPVWRFETVPTSGLYLVGSCSLDFDQSYDLVMAVSGDYAFVSNMDRSFRIYDISAPARPALAAQYTAEGSVFDFAIAGQTAFLDVSEWLGTEGLEIVDISIPASPRSVGLFQEVEDIASIALKDNILFASTWHGIFSLDISNPGSPVVIDSCRGHGWLEVSGNYLYAGNSCDFEVTCIDCFEIHSDGRLELVVSINTANAVIDMAIAYQNLFVLNNWGNIIAWDLELPTVPKYAYQFTFPEFSGYRAVFANGDLMYSSYYESGEYSLKMFNVRDIQNPIMISSYPLESPALKIYVANNYAYLIDDSPSLRILAYLP